MKFYWVWAAWFLYFGVVEGWAVYQEIVRHQGDRYTLTHFVAVTVPVGMRVALLAWLVYHFLWQHYNS